MTVASKILMSALLVGLSVPAFAQGTSVGASTGASVTRPGVAHKIVPAKPSVHKAAATTTSTTTTSTTATVKPVAPAAGAAVKTEITAKPDTAKTGTTVSTGIAKPVVPGAKVN
jgi:hypothetical protein